MSEWTEEGLDHLPVILGGGWNILTSEWMCESMNDTPGESRCSGYYVAPQLWLCHLSGLLLCPWSVRWHKGNSQPSERDQWLGLWSWVHLLLRQTSVLTEECPHKHLTDPLSKRKPHLVHCISNKVDTTYTQGVRMGSSQTKPTIVPENTPSQKPMLPGDSSM